jgi:AraC-like DNA-binding protein
MIIREIAEVFGLEQRNLARQFQRTKDKFPAGYFFVLKPEEYREQLTKKWQTAERSRTDLEQFAFTEKGALYLLRFITGDEADAAFAMLIEAFADRRNMQDIAFHRAAFKLESAYIGRSPMKMAIKRAAEDGWTFDQLWGWHDWPKLKLAETIEEMRSLRYIPQDALLVPSYVFTEARRTREMANLRVHVNDAHQMRLGLEG